MWLTTWILLLLLVLLQCASILAAQIGQKNVSLEFQYDHCFWFGDLNYRVDLNYTAPKERSHEAHWFDVAALVHDKQWDALNKNDQLRKQLELQKALTGWTLPPAQFPPTFKRLRNTTDQFNVRMLTMGHM